MSDSDFTYEKQKLLIEHMLSDEQIFQRSVNILKPEYFEKQLQHSIKYIIEHAEQYSVLPSMKQIEVESHTIFEKIVTIRDNDSDWALHNIEKFCQRQAIVHAIWNSPEFIETGNYGKVEALIKKAIEVSLQKDLGIDYFDNPKQRLKDMLSSSLIPLGLNEIDKNLYGGINRGEITIFAGASGAGKSLFLQNIALNLIFGTQYEYNNRITTFNPMNVVYISLELSELLIAKRLDTMITGIDARDIFRNINNVDIKVKIAGKNSGNLRIKQMSQGSTSADIRTYLREYEIQCGYKVDAICVDYLDLMHPGSIKISASDLFVKDKYVAEELRGLAVELDILCITASQLNRCILTTEKVNEKTKGNIEIQEIKVGDKIASYDGYRTVTEVLPITKQSVFKITTKSGKTITVSDIHKIPTYTGVKTIATGLTIGDEIVIK